MTLTLRNALLCGCIAALSFFATGCEKLRARDHLNKGVQAFKGARYADAAEHFKSAVELDPEFEVPRLYLATAYMQQFIPGAESPENQEMAKKAEEEFGKVLASDPNNKLAIESMASLRYSQASGVLDHNQKLARLDEAADWYKKLIQADPENKTGYYSLGNITWQKWYSDYKQARDAMGMKPEEPGPLKDKKVREELKAKWGATLDEGIKNLEKALQIDPEFDDAMAFVNLLIRQRADLLDTKEETEKEVKIADGWVEKALETKKIKAARLEKKSAGGIVEGN